MNVYTNDDEHASECINETESRTIILLKKLSIKYYLHCYKVNSLIISVATLSS